MKKPEKNYIPFRIESLFPDVEEIRIRVADTDAWSENRLREFTIGKGTECDFHLDCPMSKCLGGDTGISYMDVVSEMVRGYEGHRQVRLSCSGYGGYNLTFHCDWFAVLDISVRYRTP